MTVITVELQGWTGQGARGAIASWTLSQLVIKIFLLIIIKYYNRRCVFNLYENQTLLIRIDGKEEVAKIKKGVRQGCNLPPMLFNLYIEEVMKELRIEVKQGVGETINALRFADDIAFCAETEDDLRKILTNVNKILWDKYGMRSNRKKTKVMVRSKINPIQLNIIIDDARIEQVHHFNYLGSKITEDGRCKDEILNRIAQAKRAFRSKNHLLTTNSVDLEVRKRFIKICVWSIASYGCGNLDNKYNRETKTRGLRNVVLS